MLLKKDDNALDLSQNLKDKVPIVYHERYNIEFMGLEKQHPFDSCKYRRVFKRLDIPADRLISPGIPERKFLLLAHTPAYLSSLEDPATLARITEVEFLKFLPAPVLRHAVLEPMLYQMGGSVLAALVALEHGWGINLGGGFHHASADRGGGFCALADISLVIKYLRQSGKIERAMIIDLDAHQGNGHGRDFTGDDQTCIVDAFNPYIFPHDIAAMAGIDYRIEIPSFTKDAAYLEKIRDTLQTALAAFTPDIILYIAGSDILSGDPLGRLNISEEGLIARDELVFGEAVKRHIPITMLFGGGYQKSNAPVIARSILGLRERFDLYR